MPLKILFAVPLLCINFLVFGQINDNLIRQKVLDSAIPDSTFIFGKWDPEKGTETHLRYLGVVQTEDGRVFKIVTSTWLWGLSKRATNRILIFNGRNQYLGNYGMGLVCELPDQLLDGYLVFSFTNCKDCDPKVSRKLKLTKGLPAQFFLECSNKYGNFFYFSQ